MGAEGAEKSWLRSMTLWGVGEGGGGREFLTQEYAFVCMCVGGGGWGEVCVCVCVCVCGGRCVSGGCRVCVGWGWG